MSDNALQSRFLVRQGGKGWMVYDRQRKGPAMIGTSPAVNLTQEQACHIKTLAFSASSGSAGQRAAYAHGLSSPKTWQISARLRK